MCKYHDRHCRQCVAQTNSPLRPLLYYSLQQRFFQILLLHSKMNKSPMRGDGQSVFLTNTGCAVELLCRSKGYNCIISKNS
jgi:hypothetical protein